MGLTGSDQHLSQMSVVPVNGKWKIGFPAGWGAPDTLIADSLKPWKELGLSEEAGLSQEQ